MTVSKVWNSLRNICPRYSVNVAEYFFSSKGFRFILKNPEVLGIIILLIEPAVSKINRLRQRCRGGPEDEPKACDNSDHTYPEMSLSYICTLKFSVTYMGSLGL